MFHHIKANIKEGKEDEEDEEEVQINVEIQPNILRDVLDDSRKQTAEDAINCRSCKVRVSPKGKDYGTAKAAYSKVLGVVEGDRMEIFEKYCA